MSHTITVSAGLSDFQTHQVTTRVDSDAHSLKDDLRGVPELAKIVSINFHTDTGELTIVFGEEGIP